MKAKFSALVFAAAAAAMATSDASAAVACQTPFGVVPIPQFTYFSGVPCTNGYVSGLTVILPPPPPVFVPPPVHGGHFHRPPMHVPPPPHHSQGRGWREAVRGQDEHRGSLAFRVERA